MKKKLSKQQKAFCEDYVLNGKNATDAYLKHYKSGNKKTAQASASKLLSKDIIKEYLSELEGVRSDKFKVDKEYIEGLLLKVADPDLSDLVEVSDDGRFTLKKGAKAKAIASLSNISASESCGKDSYSRSFTIASKDKIKAIEHLASMNGVDLGNNESGSDGNGRSAISRLLKTARELRKK